MKNKEEKIDLLLEQNVNEQLADVNWDKLNEDIFQRLNQVSHRKNPTVRYRVLFKIAAGIAVVAAIMAFSILLETEKPNTKQIPDTQRAVVTFTKSSGTAVVEILDSNGKENQNTEQTSWMIIRKQKSQVVSNEISRDELDFACLL